MKNIFIPGKAFGFPKKSDKKSDKTFQHNCLDLLLWLCYSVLEEGHIAYTVFYLMVIHLLRKYSYFAPFLKHRMMLSFSALF